MPKPLYYDDLDETPKKAYTLVTYADVPTIYWLSFRLSESSSISADYLTGQIEIRKAWVQCEVWKENYNVHIRYLELPDGCDEKDMGIRIFYKGDYPPLMQR